ncbi:general substrate transporter [Phyllosticta capitalensis]|uniref:Quinate transporter n=1 Tax=Phyllosticta capitalensis TaxID=121624 RepID=A0ABR1YTX1_9PEZI
MVGLKVVEDRPTPSAVYNWRVYALAAVASFASCMIGYDSSFIGTTLSLNSFETEFGLDKMSSSRLALVQENIVSVFQAGAFFGSLFAYISSYYFGRKISLQIFSLIFVVGSALMLGANGDRGLGLIYAGRVLAGIGTGGASNMTPIYISELAPPAVRGRLVGIYEVGWQIGGLVGFWINYGLSETMAPSHKQWLIPFAIQLIPGGLLFLGALWIKESPRWLFSQYRRDEAMKNLCWIRNLPADDVYIIEEVSFIETAIEEQRANLGRGFWKPFHAVARSKSIQWRFILGGSLFMWQNGSGINAINYYSPTVFKSIGLTGENSSFLTTGIFGVVKTVVTFIWLFFLIDNVGRRNMLLIGAFGGSCCMWFIGAYIKVANVSSTSATENVGKGLDGGGIAAIFFFYLWTVFYTPSWNGTPWVYNSEMFPQEVRSLGQASAAANNWLWNFIISRFTAQMFLKMKYGVYFFFASLMLMSVVYVWFLVPETKSVPLEAMDRLFEIKPVRKANKTIMEELHETDERFRSNVEAVAVSKPEERYIEKVRDDDD